VSVDPQVQVFLDELVARGGGGFSTMSPVEARKLSLIDALMLGPGRPVHSVEDRVIDGPGGPLPLRIYVPTPTARGILVYFHGGGWVIGDLETHDALCREFALVTDCIVVAVDYRLAPEHRFPAAADDAFAATCWVAAHQAELPGGPHKIAVGGDSAGGNLAAAVTLMARQRGGPAIDFQALIYPVTDIDMNRPSYLANAEGYLLTRDDMAWFLGHYLATADDGLNPYASPLRAADLSGLPPALVITAEYDPLRDEGEAYAQRLREANVPTQLTRYPGMIHAFVRLFGRFDQAQRAIEEIAQSLRDVFQTKP